MMLVSINAFTASSAGAIERNGKGFVFKGDKARGLKYPDQEIKLGKLSSLFDLKTALQSYDIVLSLECSGYCFVVKQDGEAMLEVYYDEQKREIIGIVSYSPYSRDDRGNKIGDPLLKAVDAQQFECDAGESMFCKSKNSRGVSYSVADTGVCGAKQKSGTDRYTAASCARVGAVGIFLK